MASDFDMESALHAARILIVDDMPANIEVLTETLLRGGYSLVDSATDPARGLEMINAATYDLVMLDMRMPGMDGHEFVRRLRKVFDRDDLPVMVITGQTDDDTKRKALAAGVHDFITKPFVLWELLHRVRNTLELHIHHRRAKDMNVVLEQRVLERTRELEDTRKELIRRLATAGEFRDTETGRHVVRMSHIAHHLALAAGLSASEAEMIRDAAPLHDIGKIGIPDAILLKPGRLDPAEWEIMKRHAAMGASILAGSGLPLLELAHTIALTHHEQWDGNGYPQALRGEDIPIAGRIASVADVFDALTSERSYKKAWTVAQALEFLQDRAGQHFDPKLIALFSRELPAILELRERFADSEDGTHALGWLGTGS